MNNIGTSVIAFLGLIIVGAIISLLLAFPIMWCWNYTIVAIWKLPEITWGMAWCLGFLSNCFLKNNK